VDLWLDAQVAYNRIPGMSAAVVHDQHLLWSRGYGFANLEKKLPASADTIYSICSISKLFTSVAVTQLRDQGKLDLDDPVKKHLPWFNIKEAYPGSGPPTIRGILTHSSGLPRESDYPYWTEPDYPFPTHEQIVEKISKQEMLYPADTYYQYSNLGLTLAGEVVAAVSGQPPRTMSARTYSRRSASRTPLPRYLPACVKADSRRATASRCATATAS
jgi:CubicO group peptidase (beta-lactamase class C family)